MTLWPGIKREYLAPLSQTYSAPAYRITDPDELPHWTTTRNKTLHCSECAMLQAETDGASGPRMQPKQARKLRATSLKLCSRHAAAWHERDDTDSKP